MKHSLGQKLIISVIMISIVLSGIAIIISNIVIRKMIDEKYATAANELTATIGAAIDKERMAAISDKVMAVYYNSEQKFSNEQWEEEGYEEYVEQFYYLMEDEDYLAIRDSLRSFQELNSVDCIYTVVIVPEDKISVYIVDAAVEDAVTPGCFDPVYEMNYESLTNPERGYPAYITNTPEYGWLLSAATPVYDKDGKMICYSMLDINMNDIRAEQMRFSMLLGVFLSLATVIICILSIIYVRKKIIKPINMLSEAAGQYGHHQGNTHHREFSSINIHTGDELEVLLSSMVQMEQDIENYIHSLTQTKEQLSSARQHADDMQKAALLDSLTGIRNRLAYDMEILCLEEELQSKEQKNYGIAMIDLNFLKVINDTYGHEYGNAAIVSLSKIICDVFAHSPVFRIGGDEFAVLLRNNDYNKIETLQQEFNNRLTALQSNISIQPWEKLSAAFGYALFDPARDKNADDVFKRADQKMYEHKKAMKAERK